MKTREPKTAGLNSSPAVEVGESSSSFVVRLTRVLMCLSNDINTVTDIARCCNLSTSTTYRMLNILRTPFLTVYEPHTHKYYLGPTITKLASNLKATHSYLIMCALKEIRRLASISEETISLDLVMGIQLIHAYDIPSKHSLRVLNQTPEMQPVIPLGAAQKVLLSELGKNELRLALKIAMGNTPGTNVETVKMELAQIRQQGYATTLGEAIPGTLGISAPIKNYFCPVALTILGPENRLMNRVPELTRELTASTASISSDFLEFFS